MVGVPAIAKHNPLARTNFYFALVSRELAGPISSASGPLSFPSTPPMVRPLQQSLCEEDRCGCVPVSRLHDA